MFILLALRSLEGLETRSISETRETTRESDLSRTMRLRWWVSRPWVAVANGSPQDLGGRRVPHVPDQPGPFQELDQIVGDVDLPPEEPLVGRARIIVVIVVPALAQRDQGQHEVVATLVVGRIATTPDQMPERIEGERGVIAEDRA